MLASLQDRKPIIILDLWLTSELARGVLLLIPSIYFWPVTILLTFQLGSHSSTYSYFTLPHLKRTKCHRLFSFLFLHINPLTLDSPMVLLCVLQKAPVRPLIGWRASNFSFTYPPNMPIIDYGIWEVGVWINGDCGQWVYEQEKKPLLLPQWLGRKLLRAASRELVGWELDCCQAKVSTELTS